MRRIIDDKNRVSLSGVMDELSLSKGDTVDVSHDDGALIILPLPPRCAACGAQGPLLAEFGTDTVRHICTACADAVVSKTLVFKPSEKG